MDFSERKEEINKELEHFVQLLNRTLPRYSRLLKKATITTEELKELGDIEYFLLEVNSKITEIKQKLDYDLFGHSLDQYYKFKKRAKEGDVVAQQKLEIMRESFNEALKSDVLLNWN